MLRLILVSALLLVCDAQLTLAASPQAEGFQKLTGSQIRKAFAGKQFTDDTHFSFRYGANGTIEGMSMGKKVANKWVVANDHLCVTDNSGETCYLVWKKGTAVSLRLDHSDFSLDGFIK